MKHFVIALLFCQLAAIAQTGAGKYHRAKIIYNTIENLQKLEKSGVAMDHGMHKRGYSLTSDFSDAEINIARNLGLNVEIEIEDVQEYYISQNDPKKSAFANPQTASCQASVINYEIPFNFITGSMSDYLTYSEMLEELDKMRQQYPELIAERQNVGTFTTSQGRFLQWVKITKDPESINTRPQVLYTAVHHAREPISLSETIFYMWYLLENYSSNDEIKYIVDNTELYFIPVINPDGYIFNELNNPNGGGMWRKNRRVFSDGIFGVDNNRNYDYWVNGDPNQSVWNTLGVSDGPDGEIYAGTSAFSEPENQAMRYFVENHNFKIALNAHTYSNLLLYPYGYDLDVPSPDDAYFHQISEWMASQGDLAPQIASELYPASGNSDDYMYGQTMSHNKIFAFTPEIGTSFWPPSSEIIPLSKKMMFTNLTAAKLVHNYASLKDTSSEYLGNTAVVSVGFELTRLGLGGNGNFTVSIEPVSSNIISVGLPVQVNAMAISDTLNSSIQMQIASGTTSNDAIVFDYLMDNGQYTERLRVSKKFGNLLNILTDPASAIAPNWTASGWGTTTQYFVSPATSITDSPFSNYADNQARSITLINPINLSATAGATINFAAKWNLEANYDYVTLQVSNNNGASWVSQCGKYTDLLDDMPVYTGDQDAWVHEEVDISDYAGQTIKVRFRLQSDAAVNYDGFYFDDFKVNLLENSVLSAQDAAVSQFRIYPNPAGSVLNINTVKNDYNIKIFNLLGQLVIAQNNIDGFCNLDVSALTSGMYLIELRSRDFLETQKFFKK